MVNIRKGCFACRRFYMFIFGSLESIIVFVEGLAGALFTSLSLFQSDCSTRLVLLNTQQLIETAVVFCFALKHWNEGFVVFIQTLCVIFTTYKSITWLAVNANLDIVMTAMCTSYQSPDKGFVKGFSCPNPDTDSRAAFCCGFSDVKYCCDDPNSFFPYEYGYMWWLR